MSLHVPSYKWWMCTCSLSHSPDQSPSLYSRMYCTLELGLWGEVPLALASPSLRPARETVGVVTSESPWQPRIPRIRVLGGPRAAVWSLQLFLRLDTQNSVIGPCLSLSSFLFRNVSPRSRYMWPRTAMDGLQHKIITYLKRCWTVCLHGLCIYVCVHACMLV